ncbi:MAG: four helix bundle protein [Thermodesulfobacteriota bacterium]
MQDFRKLMVWQKSHALTLEMYKVTESFPKNELFGLISQIRRSCVSIPANIVEGCGRNSDPEFARFLSIAMGSATELEYHLLLARDLGLFGQTDYEYLNKSLIGIKQMLNNFIKKIRSKNSKS